MCRNDPWKKKNILSCHTARVGLSVREEVGVGERVDVAVGVSLSVADGVGVVVGDIVAEGVMLGVGNIMQCPTGHPTQL